MPTLLAFLAVFFSACSGAWGQSKDEIMRSLEARDYALFDGIDPARYNEALRLGDGAPYFIGLHLRLAGRDDQAIAMFELGRTSSPEPYSGLCLRELASLGPAATRLSAVEALLAASPDSPDLIESRERLRILAGKPKAVMGGPESWLVDRSIDAELALAVAALPPDSFSADFNAVHAIRMAVALKDYAGAWEAAKGLLSAEKLNPLLWRRGVLSDIGKAGLYGSSTPEADALFLSRLSAPKKSDPSLSFLPGFYASRLYAKANRTEKARTGFLKAIAAAKTPRDKDSACWYLLELDLNGDKKAAITVAFLADYRAYARESLNPSWYDDLLESAIVGMVNARDWAGIEILRTTAASGVDKELLARLGYIAARTSLSGTDKATTVLAEVASMRREAPYYALMASVALGRDPAVSADVTADVTADDDARDKAEQAAYSFLHGYIEWYLPERLYQAAVDLKQSLTPRMAAREVAKLADELSSRGRQGDAIRLLLLSRARADSDADDYAAFERMLYPRPWKTEISGSARRFGLDEWVLFAMIRSESLFQSGIVSGAGARGLTQLMEPTAVDIARELRQPSFDLTDPATNIEFGAYYLSRMIARLDGKILPACFAYNAGISRVRRWFDALGGLSPDIALEGLPYAETREYGRKIIVAASSYGRLYYDKTPDYVVGGILGISLSPPGP